MSDFINKLKDAQERGVMRGLKEPTIDIDKFHRLLKMSQVTGGEDRGMVDLTIRMQREMGKEIAMYLMEQENA